MKYTHNIAHRGNSDYALDIISTQETANRWMLFVEVFCYNNKRMYSIKSDFYRDTYQERQMFGQNLAHGYMRRFEKH